MRLSPNRPAALPLLQKKPLPKLQRRDETIHGVGDTTGSHRQHPVSLLVLPHSRTKKKGPRCVYPLMGGGKIGGGEAGRHGNEPGDVREKEEFSRRRHRQAHGTEQLGKGGCKRRCAMPQHIRINS